VIKRDEVNGSPKNDFASGRIECNATSRGDVESAFAFRLNIAKVEFTTLVSSDLIHGRSCDRDFARVAQPVFCCCPSTVAIPSQPPSVILGFSRITRRAIHERLGLCAK
jgi:hypothetical protein